MLDRRARFVRQGSWQRPVKVELYDGDIRFRLTVGRAPIAADDPAATVEGRFDKNPDPVRSFGRGGGFSDPFDPEQLPGQPEKVAVGLKQPIVGADQIRALSRGLRVQNIAQVAASEEVGISADSPQAVRLTKPVLSLHPGWRCEHCIEQPHRSSLGSPAVSRRAIDVCSRPGLAEAHLRRIESSALSSY
jgi:hypothetical protein